METLRFEDDKHSVFTSSSLLSQTQLTSFRDSQRAEYEVLSNKERQLTLVVQGAAKTVAKWEKIEEEKEERGEDEQWHVRVEGRRDYGALPISNRQRDALEELKKRTTELDSKVGRHQRVSLDAGPHMKRCYR